MDTYDLMQEFKEMIEANDAASIRGFLLNNPNYSTTPIEPIDGYAALHYAAWQDADQAIEVLLEANATIDSTDGHKWTALHYATFYCSMAAMKVLLLRGANPNVRDYLNHTPLHLFGRMCALDKVELKLGVDLLLTHGASHDVQSLTILGLTDQLRAFLAEHPRAVEDCVNQDELLIDSITSGNIEMTILLLNAHADPDLPCRAEGGMSARAFAHSISNPDIRQIVLQHPKSSK